MTSGDLADAVARAGWPALLPAHRAVGSDQPLGRPRYAGALPLTDGLVLAVVEDERGRGYPVPLAAAGDGVRRAAPGEGAAEALVDALAPGGPTVPGFRVTRWQHRPATGERGITVDQTNQSVVVGETAVVKWVVHADEGPHPAPSLLGTLHDAGFDGMPEPWGAVEWAPTDGAPARLLALVVAYVPGAVDGWEWAVDEIAAAAQSAEAERAEATGGSVGALVAAFHRALAPTARASTPAESASWRTAALADLDRALAATRGAAHDALASHAPAVRAVLDAVPTEQAPVMRVHGDLHVGQVLRSPGEHRPSYVLTDFDGNPVVPARERIRELPAALDVAGMAQSLLHVGIVARKHRPDLDPGTVDRMAASARASFLEAYRAGLGDHAHLLDDRLLAPFALRQVCREFTYAATHLPRWSYVPEAALPILLREDRL